MKPMISGFDFKTSVVYAFILYVYALAIYCLYQGPIIELIGYCILFIINAIFSYFLMHNIKNNILDINIFDLAGFNEFKNIAAICNDNYIWHYNICIFDAVHYNEYIC